MKESVEVLEQPQVQRRIRNEVNVAFLLPFFPIEPREKGKLRRAGGWLIAPNETLTALSVRQPRCPSVAGSKRPAWAAEKRC